MYSLNRMGFNKPLCNTRQYGNDIMTFNQTITQNNMALLKPEYLGNDRFKLLNNFDLQPHLITDKKFADINSMTPPSRNFFPSSYSSYTEKFNSSNTVIPLPADTITASFTPFESQPHSSIKQEYMHAPSTCNNSTKISSMPQTDIIGDNTKQIVDESNTNFKLPEIYKIPEVEFDNIMPKPNKSLKVPKRSKRRRKQLKQVVSTPCDKFRRIKNIKKHRQKIFSKVKVMDIEGTPTKKNMSPAVTPINIGVEANVVTLPINIVKVMKPLSTQNISPDKSSTCTNIRSFDSRHQFRMPSECESEDSFIVFDGSSNSLDSDEFEYLSSASEEDESDEEIYSIASSVEDVWPTKRVRFADDEDLCQIHPMIQWSFAYQKARKGPWEQYALDRTRFQKRISDLEFTLNNILQPEHRNKIYNERFVTGNS